MTATVKIDSREGVVEILHILARYYEMGACVAFSIETNPTGSARFSFVFADNFKPEIPGVPEFVGGEEETRK